MTALRKTRNYILLTIGIVITNIKILSLVDNKILPISLFRMQTPLLSLILYQLKSTRSYWYKLILIGPFEFLIDIISACVMSIYDQLDMFDVPFSIRSGMIIIMLQ